jgi:hypothetical protein
MTFATKKYTRPALRAAVRSVNVNNFTDFNTFAKALSPRAGRKSAQIAALRETVNTSINVLFAGSAKNNKQFLLLMLK